MAEISGTSSALQSIQTTIRTAMGIQVLKQAAKADQALAEMLARNAKAAAEASQSRPATTGISIYI